MQIRGAVDIPVIGLGEASLLAALSMGGRLGLVTIDPVFIDWHERQVTAHCFDQRVAGVRAIKMDLPGFMRAFTDEASYAKVRADFIAQVRPLVAAGAEVVIPAGGLPMLLFARERPSSSTARWCSTASRSRSRPPRWRWRCAAHRSGSQPARHICQGIRSLHRGISAGRW